MRHAGVLRVALAAAALAALAALTTVLVTGVGILTAAHVPLYSAIEGACWLVFVGAVLLLRSAPARAVPAIVVLGTLLVGAAAVTGPPITSTDSARYNWDGIVQDAGISPYRYVPADAALADLRPAWLFPGGVPTADGGLRCPTVRAAPTPQVGAPGEVCTIINRPRVPTIYPPVAEALFAAVRLVVPPDVMSLPMQLLGLVAVLATTVLLLRVLRTARRSPWWAAVFGWCPFVTTEAINNAHIDGTATFLALAASVLVVRGRHVVGGAVLGLAVATKFLPVLVAPPLARRRPWVLGLTALATFAAVYVPHVIAVGPSVIGYLPGYLDEEGYDSGSRSVLLSVLLPGSLATITAAVLIAVLAVVLLVRSDPADPWAAQTVLVGTALVLVSPAYGWYALLLVPFLVMSGRWEWFGVVITLSLVGVRADVWLFRGILLVAALIPVVVAVIRRRRGRHEPDNRLSGPIAA